MESQVDYEPPELIELGTVDELTQGVGTNPTDAVLAGS